MKHDSSMNQAPSRGRALSWLVILLFACGLGSTASAQGTMGTVPDPISARELGGYADRLGLSPQQRLALEEFHDAYREEFRVLREGEIEQFLNENRGMQGGGMGMLFDREAVEKGIKDLESLLSKIKSIDNRLFDQVQTVLTEEQMVLMQGVKQARERVRYRTGLGRMTAAMNPAVGVDLSELMLELSLTPAEREATAPLLSQYETSLTAAARKMHDGAITMMQDAFQKLADQGFTAERMRDSQRRGDVWQTLRPIMTDLQLKILEKAGTISDLHRRTAKSLTGVLGPENARELRDEYYQRAYAEINAGGGSTGRAYTVALSFDELSDEQREAITALAAEYEGSSERFNEQMMDMIDEGRRTRTFFDFDADKIREFTEKLAEIREKRNKLAGASRESLNAALGPELTERLDRRVAENKDEPSDRLETTIALTPGGGGGGVTMAVGVRAQTSVATGDEARPDPFLPGPITRRDLDNYSAILEFADEQKTILGGLHDDYLEKFGVIESAEIKAVREAEQSLWSIRAEGGEMTPPTSEAVENLYTLRQRALSAINALDASFFEDVRSTLIDDSQAPAMERVAQARKRAVYNRGSDSGDMFMLGGRGGGRGMRGGPGGGPGGRGGQGGRGAFRLFGRASQASSIDLAAIVDDVKPTPTDHAAFNVALLDYERAVTAGFQKAYEASLRAEKARDKMMAETARVDGDDRSRTVQIGADARALVEGDGRAAREARQAVAELNGSTLARLSAMLSEIDALALRRAYNLKAFPAVFDDPGSAAPTLASALQLDDLTEQQRTQVQEIASDFHGSYDQISEKMLELEAGAPDMNGPPQNRDWQGFQQRLRDREKLQFDREEVSVKAIGRLRAALNEDQVNRLGGLSDQES